MAHLPQWKTCFKVASALRSLLTPSFDILCVFLVPFWLAVSAEPAERGGSARFGWSRRDLQPDVMENLCHRAPNTHPLCLPRSLFLVGGIFPRVRQMILMTEYYKIWRHQINKSHLGDMRGLGWGGGGGVGLGQVGTVCFRHCLIRVRWPVLINNFKPTEKVL